jgi:transcriptional regulator with XRE-family HTH domain
MENEMKVSAALVRRLRTERGWSQDQLAVASGLSLRTIQRIESEGVASMSSRVSLAATFGIALAQLSDAPPAAVTAPRRAAHFNRLLLGLAVLFCALLAEALRWPSVPAPISQGLLAINLLFATAGAWLAAPPAYALLRRRQFASLALASLGMPLATLLVCGLLLSVLRAHAPDWSLVALGLGGIALIVMARRDAARALG